MLADAQELGIPDTTLFSGPAMHLSPCDCLLLPEQVQFMTLRHVPCDFQGVFQSQRRRPVLGDGILRGWGSVQVHQGLEVRVAIGF